MTDDLAPLTARQAATLARVIDRTPPGGKIWTSPDMTLPVSMELTRLGRPGMVLEEPTLPAGTVLSVGTLADEAEGQHDRDA